jgi:hypothetical protein
LIVVAGAKSLTASENEQKSGSVKFSYAFIGESPKNLNRIQKFPI